MAAVDEETGRLDLSERRKAASVRNGYTRFQSGDVLFAKITPCMENGKIAVIPTIDPNFGAGSTEFHVLEPKEVEGRFLFYWLVQRWFREQAAFNMTGTAGQKRVPKEFLQNSLVPVPPPAVQRRIVDRVDELLTELDDGEELLRRARSELLTYRQSLLKSAVSGDLTADWRAANRPSMTGEELLQRILAGRRARWQAENKGKQYKEPPGPSTDGVCELPASWTFAAMPQLGDFGRGKSKHRPRNDPRLYGGPYPFVQTGIVASSRGRITEYNQTYSEQGLAQSKLWPAKTLCITIAANIAKTGVLEFDACFPDSVVGLACDAGVDPRYIELVIRNLQAGLEEGAPATAQKNINLETLKFLPVPLPPSDEQVAIVEAYRDAEAASDLISRSEIDADAVTLRQTILAAAFRGELTQ